nr:immunoglobulin light chain junction region [Macaca mulatta]MOV64372.1 immunoglobulin light chain junction region [Macaca mulatta]
CYKYFSGYSF